MSAGLGFDNHFGRSMRWIDRLRARIAHAAANDVDAASPRPVLAGLLSPWRIALDVPAAHASDVLAHCAKLLAETDASLAQDIRADLAAREALGSTALGRGCAVPHTRWRDDRPPRCAFVRTAAPIAFDAPDGRKVDLFLALLVPRDADETHLAMLAAAAARFAEASVVTRLRRAASARDAEALLVAGEPARP
jgi:PTS system nitrogen regulatory IIA component